MRIRTGQLIYRVRSVDGQWLKKAEHPRIEWTQNEASAHVFKKLHHLVSELRDGVLSPDKLVPFLDGLPLEALEVVEYRLTVHQTGNKHRLTEIAKFYSDQENKDVKTDV